MEYQHRGAQGMDQSMEYQRRGAQSTGQRGTGHGASGSGHGVLQSLQKPNGIPPHTHTSHAHARRS